MCGIAGVFNRDGSAVDPKILVKMTNTLIHRGPDEEGYFVNAGIAESREQGAWSKEHGVQLRSLKNGLGGRGNVGLGHRRLSIIDLSTGQQPLSNEDKSIWIVFNGEIYNFKELMTDLKSKGHRFRTQSDTETIVHAYEEWGEKALDRLRGMFAFAIWDQRRQQLFLARDRVGKKPLYYLEERDRFIFGSEIKAILKVQGVSRDVDLQALSDYLSLLYIPSPKTIFRSIRKLPAAHYGIVTANSFVVRPYWDLNFYPHHNLKESQMMEDLIGILDEATRLRMISEVPLGAFLSGGVDSSAVVGLMAKNSDTPVLTNSISFSVEKYNEAPYAKRVSELFSTNHNEFHVTPDTISVIEKLAWHYDEPFADSSAVPTYYVSKIARNNVTVSLSGDGGDENFAGYPRYYFDLRENLVRNMIPVPLRRPVFSFLKILYSKAEYLPKLFRGKAFLQNVARNPVDAYFINVTAFNEEEKRSILHPDIGETLKDYRTSDIFHDIYKKAPANDHLSKIQYLDIKTYLCEDILTKVDRASMAVSLEVRCPILDHIFMEYVAKIPSKLKFVGGSGKHIFKKALKSYLPDAILYRKKKGFAVPVLEWLKGDIREYAGDLIFNGKASRLYMDKTNLEKIWREHQTGVLDRSTALWSVMILNLWHRRFVES